MKNDHPALIVCFFNSIFFNEVIALIGQGKMPSE